MADSEPSHEAHEAFHLPPPSIWPVVLAIGIALLLTGLILNIVVVIVGALITAAYAYAPRKNRVLVQLAATVGIIVIIAVAVIIRTGQLTT